MTPAQPLLPFFPTFAALERAAKPGGSVADRREFAAASPASGDDAVTHSYDGSGAADRVVDSGPGPGLEIEADADADADELVRTLVRPELQLPRAPQLPRPQLFARFSGSARGSSPDLLRRRR